MELDFKIHISHKKTLESVLKIIEEKIIIPILDSEDDEDIKIQKIIKLVSNKDNIFFHIDKIRDISEKKSILDKLNFSDDSFNKNKLLNETMLRTYIEDNQGTSTEILSMFNIMLEDKMPRIPLYLNKENINQYYYTDFSSITSKIYLLNEAYKFAINNKEVIEHYILELVRKSYFVHVSEDKSLKVVSNLKKKYNLENKITFTDSSRVNPIIRLIEGDAFNICNNFIMRRDSIDFSFFEEWAIDNIYLVLRYIKKENKRVISETKLKYKAYALTYETKRNIPTKTLEKMKDNKFLKWFGYVEIDENCDLNTIAQLENEFEDYMKQINLVTKGKDHSLRFKKLGKQKAGGLYYPNEKAVCIGIKQHSSCTHEIFHMIDHITIKDKKLSYISSFREIEDTYIALVTEEINKLDEGDKIRKKFYGRSQNNKYYYFKPTEIFARCGELYISSILKINNSLINKEGGVYYPQDKEFLKLIKIYYNNLFRGIKKGLY